MGDCGVRERGQDAGDTIRARRIAGRDLPDLADALELADVKGVQADQLARALGDDVPRLAVAQAPEGLPRALGEQAGPRGTVMLEHQQALTPRRQAMPPQQALHSARRHAQSPEALRIGGQAGAAPRGFRDRDGQQASLDVRGQLGHRSRSGLQPARMHAIDPVAFQPAPPAVKHGARDPYLAARRTDADHLRPLNDVQPHSLYALVQGHRSILPKWSLAGGCHSGNDRPDGPLLFGLEVSTLTRPRTL